MPYKPNPEARGVSRKADREGETVTSDPVARPILFRIEMVAGHGGKSGRYDAWKQYAWELAFVMDQVGVR